MIARSVTVALGCVLAILAASLEAQTPPPAAVTLFQNVRIFDGKGGERLGAVPCARPREQDCADLVDADPIDRPADTVVIDGGGRTLMPGLIDMHWHAMLVRPTPASALAADIGYSNLVAGAEATDTLMRGFTTVRDLGGPAFGLKRAIDEGVVVGPRIYPSGAVITVTSGHGDFRQPFEVPRILGGPLTRMEAARRAASSPTVPMRCACARASSSCWARRRSSSPRAAAWLRPTARWTCPPSPRRSSAPPSKPPRTGARTSPFTPTRQPPSSGRSPPGVKCIEHGHLMDEATAKLIAERGIWLSIQPFPGRNGRRVSARSQERAKAQEVLAGTETAYGLAKKYKIKTAFGTDILFSAGAGAAPGSPPGQAGPLVYAGGSAGHGHRHQRRSCWRCPASAILTRASWASSKKVRWPICCSLTATRSRTSP